MPSLEDAEKAIYDALYAGMAAALAAVEAARGATPALGDVATWLQGYYPTVVERPQADFPIVAVFGNASAPAGRADQWGWGQSQPPVLINWFVAEDTEAACNVLCKRYGEALTAVIQANQFPADGLEVISYKPPIELSEVLRDLPPSSGSVVSGDAYYTQMGQMTVTLRESS